MGDAASELTGQGEKSRDRISDAFFAASGDAVKIVNARPGLRISRLANRMVKSRLPLDFIEEIHKSQTMGLVSDQLARNLAFGYKVESHQFNLTFTVLPESSDDYQSNFFNCWKPGLDYKPLKNKEHNPTSKFFITTISDQHSGAI